MTDSLHVGQTIELKDGRQAIIRFLGTTHFAAGDWVGVELDDASGKNDGSVQGERYFDCDTAHGMFLREAGIARIVEQQQSKAPAKPNARANGQVGHSAQGRPSSGVVNGLKRLSTIDPGNKRQSMNIASPTPGARGISASSGLRSPAKSPTKPAASTTSSGPSSRTATPPVAGRGRPSSTIAPKSRPSMAPPASKRTSTGPTTTATTNRSVRPSVGGVGSSFSRTAKTPTGSQERPVAGQPSLAPKRGPAQQSPSPTKETEQDAGESNAIGQALSPGEDITPPLESPVSESLQQESSIGERLRSAAPPNGQAKASRPSANRRPSSPQSSARQSRPVTASNREVEDLKAKLKVMERKRLEDREKLKSLDRIQQERDRFESIIQKLQTKYQPQQQEIADLKKQLRESSEKTEGLEKTQAEHDSIMEMATLDREMAEETAEGYKTELQAVRERMEELQLEVEILQEENQELGKEMSPEEKTSQGWLQLERTNERLREALLRLRDLTQEREDEMRHQIHGLEADVRDLTETKEVYEIAKEKLLQSEADIEDLRQQLEAALGAEEMIEELTERNQALTERMDELNTQIEDLESLKELNDELEINHVEAEKQMQEEIDFKESLVIEHNRRAAQQDERLQDYEYTLTRFRELVSSQQSAIDDMTAARQVTESEAADLNERSKAMMDLNMKLQMSASKTQVKTIDLELRRLDAQEAAEHLAIVQLFLPETFQTERDSVLALLRFKRIGFKAQLIHGFVKEKLSGRVQSGHEDDLFAACDILDKLAWITAMCERFTNSISSCSIEHFAKFEGALYELEPVERALNSYVEGLKKEELKEQKVAEELQRSMAVMDHLAEIHLQPSLESYADDILMRTLMTQSHLENTAAALAQTKAMVQAKVQNSEDTSEEEANELEFFSTKADTLISASRSAKVIVGKALRSLEELKSRCLTLNEDTEPAFTASEESASELAAYTRSLGTSLHSLLSEEGRTTPFTATEIAQTVSTTTTSFFSLPTPEPSLLSTLTTRLRSTTNALTDLATTATDLTLTTEFTRAQPPWVLRAAALKDAKLTAVDTEALLARAREENAAKAREMRQQEHALEEQAVKIELLEARMKDAGRRSARIAELEREIAEVKGRERELGEGLKRREEEVRRVVEEREELRRVAGERKEVVVTGTEGRGVEGEKAVATGREMEGLRERIRELEGAVRWLREDNRRARVVEPAMQSRVGAPKMDWLAEPLLSKTRTPEQQRRETVKAEGKEVLSELLELVDGAKPVDLSALPENKLAWQPAREKPRFQLLKQAEDYEAWAAWRDEVLKQAKGLRNREQVKMQARQTGKVAARVNFLLPTLPSEKVQDTAVRIVEPGEFDDLKEAIGVA
ncbi:hypothetical protein EV356DRAFT_463346 [Viridothelium virens]|uniref:CAP-Gly domain-containing protein n=1 Tax=Viridothelium virens TaxID=1048519 RepID=A0A6A6HEW8_VIRVR|nr:hypothetical protein EV356DRAFT_463346 [Viridothelium virens]